MNTILLLIALAQAPFVEGRTEIPYLLLKPETVEAGKKYPLILFLHGAGERGDDNRLQMKHFPEKMVTPERRAKYPCFLLAPQCPKEASWGGALWRQGKSDPLTTPQGAPARGAVEALRKVVREEPVDTTRIYLTGLSMGGYGSWDLAVRHPDWFAAVAPICGGGSTDRAARLVGLPVWNWHGDKDQAVPVDQSRKMIQAIKDAGGEARYTELPGVGHDSWVQAYGPEGMLDWLFEQKRDSEKMDRGGLAVLAGSLRKGDKIVFLGDSITQQGAGPGGYVNLIKEAVPTVEIVGAGISGHRVPDLQKRLEKDVLSHKPTAVFIYIGINDVWHQRKPGGGTTKDAYETGLRDIVGQIQKAGATVILATPTTIGEKPDNANAQDALLEEYAAVSRKVAEEAKVLVCDLRRDFVDHLKLLNPAGAEKGILTGDGVHLNGAGNRFVAGRAAWSIAEALRARP